MKIANIVQAQLLFLESADASKDIQIYFSGGSVYAGLEFMTRCNTSSQIAICTGMAASMNGIVMCRC
jgi:ATP-dependent Clp protease protease subunit